MSKIKFKLNGSGVRELLRGPEIQGVLDEKASAIKARAGAGFAQDSYVGKKRANAMVYPDTDEAFFRNLHANILLKALK